MGSLYMAGMWLCKISTRSRSFVDLLHGNVAIPRAFPIENTTNFELCKLNWSPLLEHYGKGPPKTGFEAWLGERPKCPNTFAPFMSEFSAGIDPRPGHVRIFSRPPFFWRLR